jgi:hypothetical protein
MVNDTDLSVPHVFSVSAPWTTRLGETGVKVGDIGAPFATACDK